ncbi:hypothetical protein K438DRAFT_1251381 [Mycena galopus ATCC 62051]|nr:hypothetical protein K438DRAFT_1251381 [Mycena galopus ATCC 62051]
MCVLSFSFACPSILLYSVALTLYCRTHLIRWRRPLPVCLSGPRRRARCPRYLYRAVHGQHRLTKSCKKKHLCKVRWRAN